MNAAKIQLSKEALYPIFELHLRTRSSSFHKRSEKLLKVQE
jgi:hypothetical protein